MKMLYCQTKCDLGVCCPPNLKLSFRIPPPETCLKHGYTGQRGQLVCQGQREQLICQSVAPLIRWPSSLFCLWFNAGRKPTFVLTRSSSILKKKCWSHSTPEARTRLICTLAFIFLGRRTSSCSDAEASTPPNRHQQDLSSLVFLMLEYFLQCVLPPGFTKKTHKLYPKSDLRPGQMAIGCKKKNGKRMH